MFLVSPALLEHTYMLEMKLAALENSFSHGAALDSSLAGFGLLVSC